MNTNKITIKKRIGSQVKTLRNILTKHRITERHPLCLSEPVGITQTLDGKGYLDWAEIKVTKIWHDRTTVVIETEDNQTVRLVDSYETAPDGHYADAWWNIKNLITSLQKDNKEFMSSEYRRRFQVIVKDSNTAQNVSDIIRKVGTFLQNTNNKGVIVFDHNAYEYEEDIPHINVGNERLPVLQVEIPQDGSKVITTVLKNGKQLIITILNDSSDNEELFDELNLYGLLSDTYYETEESWEIGDFEENFLKNS